jgi:DNA gyrase subunit A
MDPIAKSVVPIRIQDEMRSSYMDYSMSVIIGRALPDVRDGLKPVHRRILYAMRQMGLTASKKYMKCAGVVGEVLKLYHPHGDSAVYDALVRMAQDWNLRYVLVDGQGNFGSVDGDPAAAYRYTECRMTRLAEELLVDIEKETVAFGPNFDGGTEEPLVLPARFPNLLVNGADGIAVGMATRIPPHNLREVVDACIALIERPDLDVDQLMRIIPGPDFPTGGAIYGIKGVREAYESGRGRVVVRGRTHFEDLPGGRTSIIIDEIPYQVNKARLVEQIAELVKTRRLEGISALRDESDRQGMRVVVELKRDTFPEVVLNHLFKHTHLQQTYGVILLAIVNQRPRVLSLREMLQHYISHRRDVVQRRTRYELRKARERAHIVEGYLKALDLIDAVIALIRESASVVEARDGLITTFGFSEVQAEAILEMRLQRLTGMERQKLLDEHAELLVKIARYEEILGSEAELMGVVRSELVEVRDQYGDERRTILVEDTADLDKRDLVPPEDQVVTVSHLGYIKRTSPDEWRMQRRGGSGKRGMTTREADFVTSLFVANTHDLLLVFTSEGRVLPLHVYDVPEATTVGKGKPIVNLVPIEPQTEKIASIVSFAGFEGVAHLDVGEGIPEGVPDLVFMTRFGRIKRTSLWEYRNLRGHGLIATGIPEGDELVQVRLVDDPDAAHALVLTRRGMAIRFPLAELRTMGRPAMGNRAIKLSPGDEVVDVLLLPGDAEVDEGVVVVLDAADADGDESTVDPDHDDEDLDAAEAVDDDELPDDEDDGSPRLLFVTDGGYGKRTQPNEFRAQHRYGKGIRAQGLDGKSGTVVGAVVVEPADQVMVVTDTGRIIRFEAGSVRRCRRTARGVRLMRLEDGERIVDVARLVEPEDDVEDPAPADAEGAPLDAEGAPLDAEGADEE